MIEFLAGDIPALLQMVQHSPCTQAAASYIQTISESITGYLVMETDDIASSQLSDSLCRLLQALKDNNMMSPQLVISVYNCIE